MYELSKLFERDMQRVYMGGFMGGRLTKKGYRGRPQVPINTHALSRLRERWPEASYLYDSELKFLVSEQVLDALGRDDYIVAPGGVYIPISILGDDGYVVLIEGQIKTAMPTSWCLAVEKTRSKRQWKI